MTIRDERASDIAVIFDLTKAAFANHLFGDHTEQFVTDALRAADVLTFSLVAEISGEVVGHVAFSPVTISDGMDGWYGLGPIAVRTDRQKQGIGSALIREGLSRLQARGAKGCLLLGDVAFYGRFGFINNPHLVLAGVPQEYFLVLPFAESQAKGNVLFHNAFSAKA